MQSVHLVFCFIKVCGNFELLFQMIRENSKYDIIQYILKARLKMRYITVGKNAKWDENAIKNVCNMEI